MFKLTSQFAGLLKLCYEQMFFGDSSFSFAQKVKKNIQCVHIFGITRVQYKGVCMRLVHLIAEGSPVSPVIVLGADQPTLSFFGAFSKDWVLSAWS